MAGTDLIVTLIDWIDREAMRAVQTFFFFPSLIIQQENNKNVDREGKKVCLNLIENCGG